MVKAVQDRQIQIAASANGVREESGVKLSFASFGTLWTTTKSPLGNFIRVHPVQPRQNRKQAEIMVSALGSVRGYGERSRDRAISEQEARCLMSAKILRERASGRGRRAYPFVSSFRACACTAT